MDAFELFGYWWLPENEGVHEVAGRLTFEPLDVPRLELHGSLTDASMVDFESESAFSLVHGVTEDGKQWTLLDLDLVSATNRMPGYPVARFRAGAALKNLRFKDESPRFDHVWVGLSHLSDWVGRSVWSVEVERDEADDEPRFKVEYVRPPEISAFVPTLPGTLHIVHSYGHSGGALGATPHLSEDVFFRVELTEGYTLDEILHRIISPLRDLITLATETPNAVTSLSVADSKVRIERDMPDPPPLVVQVYAYVAGKDSRQDRVHPAFMLFDLNRLGTRFSEVLPGWFDIADRLDVVFNLLFGQEYMGDAMLEPSFLAYAQAAEAYHRTRFGGTDLSAKEHAERRAEILESAPEQHRKWLKGRLTYSNELTFRSRLRDLYDHAQPTMTGAVARKSFVNALVTHRNALTHRDRNPRRTEADWNRIYWTMQATKRVLRACLLRDSGFTAEEVADFFGKSQPSIRAKHNIREYFS